MSLDRDAVPMWLVDKPMGNENTTAKDYCNSAVTVRSKSGRTKHKCVPDASDANPIYAEADMGKGKGKEAVVRVDSSKKPVTKKHKHKGKDNDDDPEEAPEEGPNANAMLPMPKPHPPPPMMAMALKRVSSPVTAL